MDAIRVIIVDVEPIFREELRSLLESEVTIEIVAEAASTEEALLEIANRQPDVVLIDVVMPELGGIEVTYGIKFRWPAIKVIAMSAIEQASLIRRSFAAGADGFLLKTAPRELIIRTIQAVHAGGTVI